jgi:ParB-like chromosome segregation protein Spo0J
MILEVNINEIKPNPQNPRVIKDDKFKKLVQSIKEFPEMLNIRPIVVNKDMIVLGGNMRLKACREAGLKEIPIIYAENLDEDKQREFIIKDNVGFGEWDWNNLKEWDQDELIEWGLDIHDFENTELDYSDKNKEIQIDNLDGTMVLKLNYTEDEYWKVKQQLLEIAITPEQAIWKLLGNE